MRRASGAARVQEQVVLGDLEQAPDAGAVGNEVGGASTSSSTPHGHWSPVEERQGTDCP
jgi:hypothetical protein